MSRRKARVLAFQALYCFDVSGTPLETLLEFDWEADKLERIDSGVLDFARNLAAGTIENLDEIDAKIKLHLRNWDFSRLKKVDLAILRTSLYSLLYQKESAGIVIEEAICICKEYGASGSLKFINAVLDNINKETVKPNVIKN
ncbi:MAG: transcription antitermination factor NusB [Spirochaetaceae bacterium]|jgi:N utilization substance protein B|nr:transcription antitermination factor NusB [Spirochaetaceae bacterium]GMO29403.1 MAG: transcription antitermination factor NusB [Termitinemataceae bacterium]